MKKARLKEKKVKKELETESTMSGKAVAMTFLSLMVIFVAFYFLTEFLISKQTTTTESSDSNSSSNETALNISFSELLKQSDDEYYVFAIMEDDSASFYERYADAIGTTYYEIDMGDVMNKAYVGEETNISEKIKDIKIAESTLFVIEDGKIAENYTGRDNIAEYLQTKLPKS
jgi:hypothetical protein